MLLVEVVAMSFHESPAVQKLSPEVKAQAVEAARPAAMLMEKATQHRAQESAAPSDHSGSKEALRHNQSSVEKTQAPLSPTDGHKGHAHSRGMER
jgi:hypothetical protein